MGRERIDKEREDAPRRALSALSIAGLDPSSGAGLTADLRAFRAAGAWGASACAVLTVQSTRGLASAHPVAPEVVVAQVEHVLGDLEVRAMKSGALGSEANVRAVAGIFQANAHIPAVVDPVMAPSRALAEGARLDGKASNRALWELLRAAALITPNADEASALLDRRVRSELEARAAAEELVRQGARAVLLKGGHLEDRERAVDWLATPRAVVAIARKRLQTPPLHGTGCTLSALIAGRLAVRVAPGVVTDAELLAAIRWARAALDRALRAPVAVGLGASVLDARPGGAGAPALAVLPLSSPPSRKALRSKAFRGVEERSR